MRYEYRGLLYTACWRREKGAPRTPRTGGKLGRGPSGISSFFLFYFFCYFFERFLNLNKI
jgi:hypothetical protein